MPSITGNTSPMSPTSSVGSEHWYLDESSSATAQHSGSQPTLPNSSGKQTKKRIRNCVPVKSLPLEQREKRREQNRQAQRAYRERKEQHIKELEDELNTVVSNGRVLSTAYRALRDELDSTKQQLVQNQHKLDSSTFHTPDLPSQGFVTADSASHGFNVSDDISGFFADNWAYQSPDLDFLQDHYQLALGIPRESSAGSSPADSPGEESYFGYSSM